MQPSSSLLRRSVPRMSLWALMVWVLVLGGGLGYFALRAREQHEAVATIRQGGGTVVYRSKWWGDSRKGSGLWRILDALGPDYFCRVKEVYAGNTADDAMMDRIGRLHGLELLVLNSWQGGVTDEGFVHLRGLTDLKTLDVNCLKTTGAILKNVEGMRQLKKLRLNTAIPITDTDLTSLQGLASLEVLEIRRSEITDTGLAHLCRLVNLKELWLTSSRITQAGLPPLGRMARLERLYLSESQVTDLAPIRHLSGLRELSIGPSPIDDAGLAPVAGFTQLQTLDLNGTRITDTGLAHLRGLTRLKILNLPGTQVTEAGLIHLEGLTRLEQLWLNGTKVTEAGLLAHLKGLTRLKELGLSNGMVTATGERELQTTIPALVITY